MPDDQPPPAATSAHSNRISVEDTQNSVTLDLPRWQRFTGDVVDALGVRHMGVSLTFVDTAEIAGLKTTHLDGDGAATDVLAFPLDDPSLQPAADGPPLELGDIVLCPAVAAAQAPTHAGTVDAEIALLIVHAALHLVGHDHFDGAEREAMQAEERRLLASLFGPLPADPWSESAATSTSSAQESI